MDELAPPPKRFKQADLDLDVQNLPSLAERPGFVTGLGSWKFLQSFNTDRGRLFQCILSGIIHI